VGDSKKVEGPCVRDESRVIQRFREMEDRDSKLLR